MDFRFLFYLLLFLFSPALITAQSANEVGREQCGTMERLRLEFARNPQLRARFEQENLTFTNAVKRNAFRQSGTDSNGNLRTLYTIPIVFHIVATNPASISDASILAQLDILNKAFSATNGDTVKIPAYFKPLMGQSGIQFCLAQKNSAGEETSGIERVKTTIASFDMSSEAVKHASTGGADSWDTHKYYNVWLCKLTGGLLGYSTYPDSAIPVNEQGSVIDYGSLPGGTLQNYNTGKTLPHETGHYLNLYHIWGDDGGACTGTDYVDDTPNQADATKNCPGGIKTDFCTPTGNGIMYQNYMDYSYDSCLVMFTSQQVTRMESALVAYRSSLLTSNVCSQRNYDVRLSTIDQPVQRVCNSLFTPVVSIQNKGIQILTSLDISARIDNGTATTLNWKGSLAFLASASVTLSNISTTAGVHTLTIYVSNPDNKADEYHGNDTISTTIQFYNPVTTISESFETTSFPPTGWDIVNPDGYITWKRVTGISKTGTYSVMVENFTYNSSGEKDDLQLPNIALQNVNSAFLSFQVAAATYTDAVNNNNNNKWDTLQVLASSDCGLTYTSIYKKYGKELVTRPGATTTSFTPTASEWRKDSVNISNYIGQNNILLTFRNSTAFENNIYLDDINLRTAIINPNLKRLGFLVTPNPARSSITVQFYPQPANLKALQVYDVTGQKITEVDVANGQASNYYRLDITRYAAGTYIVRAVFSDRVITRKIIKY